MNENQSVNILFLIDKQSECDRIANLLGDLEFEIEWHWADSLKTLREYQDRNPCDLLLYWHQRKLVDESELTGYLDLIEDDPALILVADQTGPRDFIHASQLNAVDVINAGILAQFAFVVRREVASIYTRRKLEQAIEEITGERILDESTLDTHVEIASMSEVVEVIDDALKNNKFELLFQPIVAVQNDGYENYEIFLRIRHKGDFLKPADFIPTAEKYDLMPSIDEWVVNNAIKRFKAEEEVRKIRKLDEMPLRFFINISPYSLEKEDVMKKIISDVIFAKLSPGRFVFEVDKNAVLNRLKQVKLLNQSVKKLNLEFALDHYEQKDNKLNYLKHIALDYLKVDGEILNLVHKEPAKAEAVREIVQKARENNIKVIASQVENADALPVLYGLGVDYTQGFLIGEPGTRLEYQGFDTTITATVEQIKLDSD